jgi:hypothetical protein
MINGSSNHQVEWINTPLVLLAFMMLLLTVKSDRNFPFPRMPETTFQLVLIPYTICFLLAAFFLLVPEKTPRFLRRIEKKIAPVRLALYIVTLFEGIALVLLFIQNWRYAGFGYALNIPLTGCVFVILGAVLVVLWTRKNTRPRHLFFFAVVAYTLTGLISLVSFPLNPGRSDMFEYIVYAGTYFLKWINPYSLYHLAAIPPFKQFTYLPGLWLSYLPAVVLTFDPRFINIAGVLASVPYLSFRECQRDLRPVSGNFSP